MVKRLLPLLIIGTVLVLFLLFNLDHYFSLEAVRTHRESLLTWVSTHGLLAPLAYMFGYAVAVTFSLPVASLMTLAGGFLFGALFGAVYALAGATMGATVLFLVAKTSVGDYLLARAGGAVKKMQSGFAKNALSYMFVLRLVPIFPFFLVNLAPAFLGVSLRVYVAATFFGMMPAAYVYALAGSGLGGLLDQEGEMTVGNMLTTEILLALLGLALLSLIPALYNHFHRVPGEKG